MRRDRDMTIEIPDLIPIDNKIQELYRGNQDRAAILSALVMHINSCFALLKSQEDKIASTNRWLEQVAIQVADLIKKPKKTTRQPIGSHTPVEMDRVTIEWDELGGAVYGQLIKDFIVGPYDLYNQDSVIFKNNQNQTVRVFVVLEK